MIAAGVSDDAAVKSATASYCGARASASCAEAVKSHYGKYNCEPLKDEGDKKAKSECQAKFKNALAMLKEVERGSVPKTNKDRLYLEARRLSGSWDSKIPSLNSKAAKAAVDKALAKVGKDLSEDVLARTHVLAVKPDGSVQLSNLQLTGGGEVNGVALYATKPYPEGTEYTPGATGYVAAISTHIDLMYSYFKLVGKLGFLGMAIPNGQSILGVNSGDYSFNTGGAEGGVPASGRLDDAALVFSGAIPLGKLRNWFVNFEAGAGLVMSARMLDGSSLAFNATFDQTFGMPNNTAGSSKMRGLLAKAGVTYKDPLTLADVLVLTAAFLYGSAKVAWSEGAFVAEGDKNSLSVSALLTPSRDPLKLAASIGRQSASGDSLKPSGCDKKDAAHCNVDIEGNYNGSNTFFSASASRVFNLDEGKTLTPAVGYRYNRIVEPAKPIPYSEHTATAVLDFGKLANPASHRVDLSVRFDYARKTFDPRQVGGSSNVVIQGTDTPATTWSTGASVLMPAVAIQIDVTEKLQAILGYQLLYSSELMTGTSSIANVPFVAVKGKI